MNEKALDKVMQYIDALAAKLGVAAEHVYGVLVRQQLAEGITHTAILTVSFIVSLVTFVIIFRALANYVGYNDEPCVIGLTITGFSTFVLFAANFVLFAANVILLPGYIMHIINPEYYAIREILDVIK